jgi:hypothetical protein
MGASMRYSVTLINLLLVTPKVKFAFFCDGHH